MVRRQRGRFALRLTSLEDRLAPAGINALVSRAEPTLYADTGSGTSMVGVVDLSSPGAGTTTRAISDDGRYVTFASDASNLVAGQSDSNADSDVFLLDRSNNSVQLVSHQGVSALAAGSGRSVDPVISADGRFIVFQSQAIDLVSGMTSGATTKRYNVFLFDRQDGSIKLVSHSAGNLMVGSSFDAIFPNISGNGALITFRSQATNLISGFPNPGGSASTSLTHGYGYDCSSAAITLIDHASGVPTTPGNGTYSGSVLSENGQYVLFSSRATNLLSTATTSQPNVYRLDRQTGDLTLVSRNSGTSPLGGNGSSGAGVMSSDGRWILIASAATNLVGGATVSGNQIYLCDMQTSDIILVSHAANAPLTGGNGTSTVPRMSADGRYVVYATQATNLIDNFSAGHGTTTYDYYLYDRVTDQTKLINHQAASATSTGNIGADITLPTISSDGRYITFADRSTDLVAGFVDNNDPFDSDLYLYDRDTGLVTLLSGKGGSSTNGGNGESQIASASLDGSVLAWFSLASDLISGVTDTNGFEDVYIRDFSAGTTQLVSRRQGPPSMSAGGVTNNSPVLSADGRYVVYTNQALNLIPGQGGMAQVDNVFLQDRVTGTMTLVSHAYSSPTTGSNSIANAYAVSADGRYVAYASYATNIVANFTDGNPVAESFNTDVYLFDRITGINTLVSHRFDSATISGNNGSGSRNASGPRMSADGRYIFYISKATDLVNGQVNGSPEQLFVYDRLTGGNTLLSHVPGSSLTAGNGNILDIQVSADSRYVTFTSSATDLVAGMIGSSRNLFLYDRQTDTTVLVNHTPGSALQANGSGADYPAISADGRFVAYISSGDNLVGGQVNTNGGANVFVYDRDTGINTLATHAFNSNTTTADQNGNVWVASISADGRWIGYQSTATNLVAGYVDNNGTDSLKTDAYLYDRIANTSILLSYAENAPASGGNNASGGPMVSGDGRFVVFGTQATNLNSSWTFPAFSSQAVLYDRLTGLRSLVSYSTSGTTGGGNATASPTAISSTGDVIVYISASSNLVAGDLNNYTDVFAYVQSPPTVSSVVFGDGTSQRSLVKQLVVTFSEPVSFMGSVASAFTVHRSGPGGVVGNVDLTANPTSGPASQVTITFSGSLTEFGSLIDGVYDFMIGAAQVSGVGGALDGNNDGIAGGSYVVTGSSSNSFYRLFGDSNGDRKVDLVDMAALRGSMGQASSIFDFDNKGYVLFTDYTQFRSRFNLMV